MPRKVEIVKPTEVWPCNPGPTPQDFPMRRKLHILLALVPLLAGGCMTHKMWTEGKLDEWNEPAAQVNLRVFDAEAKKDFLVVYDERSDRHDTIQTRAFFLNQNLERLNEKRAPRFVDPGMTTRFTALPLWYGSAFVESNAPARPFVLAGTNSESFTLCLTDGQPEKYHLPVYADNIGDYERVALTPVTVTLDLTIIGGFLGCYWIYTGGPGLGR